MNSNWATRRAGGEPLSCFLEEAQAFSGVGKARAVPGKAVESDHLEVDSHWTTP